MTPYVSTDKLENGLKNIWTEELLGSQMKMNRDMNRQLYWPTVSVNPPYHVDMSPAAVRERNKRQAQMMLRLQVAKRKGKPSYRQRQKNARAARG